jgi:hypothetical protein
MATVRCNIGILTRLASDVLDGYNETVVERVRTFAMMAHSLVHILRCHHNHHLGADIDDDKLKGIIPRNHGADISVYRSEGIMEIHLERVRDLPSRQFASGAAVPFISCRHEY